jgi:hypothetical protein
MKEPIAMSVGDQLGIDENSELLDRVRRKWSEWVAWDPRLDVVAEFDDLRAWLPSVDRDASDEVLLALAMLAAADGGDDVAAAVALAKCLLPGACRLAGWLSALAGESAWASRWVRGAANRTRAVRTRRAQSSSRLSSTTLPRTCCCRRRFRSRTGAGSRQVRRRRT